jgi:riboflavin kinase/FMN adenylyltransferase
MELSGIYAARVVIEGKQYPTAVFADEKRDVLEAHILDKNLDLYGKEITIELLQKLRDAKTFSNDEDLRAAIADDIEKVREYFKKNPAAD